MDHDRGWKVLRRNTIVVTGKSSKKVDSTKYFYLSSVAKQRKNATSSLRFHFSAKLPNLREIYQFYEEMKTPLLVKQQAVMCIIIFIAICKPVIAVEVWQSLDKQVWRWSD